MIVRRALYELRMAHSCPWEKILTQLKKPFDAEKRTESIDIFRFSKSPTDYTTKCPKRGIYANQEVEKISNILFVIYVKN